MTEPTTTLTLVAENYGLPGMVLFSLVILIGFLSFGLPRLIHAIREPKGDDGRGTPPDTDTPPPARSKGPGVKTQAWTRDEVARAKDDVGEKVDLKLEPIRLVIDQIKKDIESGVGRDKEHYGKLDDLASKFAGLDKRLARMETATKIRHGKGSGLTQHGEEDGDDH